MDDSPPGSSIHGILQARILDCVAISFSKRSSRPRDWTCVSCTGGKMLYHWATELNLAIPLCNPQSRRGFMATTSNLSFGHVSPGPLINSPWSFLGKLESPHHPLAKPAEEFADCFTHGPNILQIMPMFHWGVCHHTWDAVDLRAATAGLVPNSSEGGTTKTQAAATTRGDFALSRPFWRPPLGTCYSHPVSEGQGYCQTSSNTQDKELSGIKSQQRQGWETSGPCQLNASMAEHGLRWASYNNAPWISRGLKKNSAVWCHQPKRSSTLVRKCVLRCLGSVRGGKGE